LSYINTLHRAHELERNEDEARKARSYFSQISKSIAAKRCIIPKLQAEVAYGQELLLIWLALATSACRIWLPAKLTLSVLANAWKAKQKQAVVILAANVRFHAQKKLRNLMALTKAGPKMILLAKIARKRVACRTIQTFLIETKSVYTAVRNLKKFRVRFAAAREMVLQHLTTKYHRIRWLLTFWNKLERSRLMASRCVRIRILLADTEVSA
jgi:hypothetical protein